MQVDDNDTSLHKDEITLNDGFIPWTATDMSAHTRLRCGKCHNPILNEGKVWKDLPSGNWAEMMDFWHCHKPDPPEEEKNKGGEDPNAVVKGYGAGNQLVAVEGTVLVDVTSFLVKGMDCLGVEETKVRNFVFMCFWVALFGVWFCNRGWDMGNKKETFSVNDEAFDTIAL